MSESNKPLLIDLMLSTLRFLASDATADDIGWCDVSRLNKRMLAALAQRGLITRNEAARTACITGRGRKAIDNHIAYNSAEHVRSKRKRLQQRVNGTAGGVTADDDTRSVIPHDQTADTQKPDTHKPVATGADCTVSGQAEACPYCLHRAVLERLIERVPAVRALYEAERMRRAAEATFDEILAQMGGGHGE